MESMHGFWNERRVQSLVESFCQTSFDLFTTRVVSSKDRYAWKIIARGRPAYFPMAADLRIVKSYEFTRFFSPCLYLRPLPTFHRSRARALFAVEAEETFDPREDSRLLAGKIDFKYHAVIIR